MFRSHNWRLAAAFALIVLVGLAPADAVLKDRVKVAYDQYHVPTVRADTEYDAIVMQGYLHAQDRFFQMDTLRRTFSGTLAELVGPTILGQDVQLRTLGLRRAAERSMAVQSPETLEWLEAYSEGVNAWLTDGMFGRAQDDDSCSSGGVSSDESWDGASEASSDQRDTDSDDSSEGHVFIPNALPPEYAALSITRDSVPLWTPLDSLTVAKGLAFGLSFDLGDIDRTLALLTFSGAFGSTRGLQTIQSDLYRAAPFDSTASIPTQLDFTPIDDLGNPVENIGQSGGGDDVVEFASNNGDSGSSQQPLPEYLTNPELGPMLEAWRAEILESPVMTSALEADPAEQGSNWWIADGSKTVSGYPMLANDPHLSLGTPATFYENHLVVKNGGINVTGISFPGVPGVALGCNETVCWGATVNRLDVTDVYQEILLALSPDPTVPTHTFRADGPPEPLQFLPQAYSFNVPDGAGGFVGVQADAHAAGILPPETTVTLIVPRRNNGPIVQTIPSASSPSGLAGLSVMYTGFSGTTELEAFRRFARSSSPQEFEDALQYFDVGSQNWAYADIDGNIAYWTSAELPLREDLQFGLFPDGLQPPYFLRDGTHTLKHEWLPVINPQPNQSIPYEILPFAEMPQVINPADGLVYNCNNDPIGTTFDNVSWNDFRAGFNGRLYLSPDYAPGFRQGRLRELLADRLSGGGKLDLQDYKDLQGDNGLTDAKFFVPEILGAFDRAATSPVPDLQFLASLPNVQEAIARLAAWNFTTPTGLAEGYDPGDAAQLAPTQAEIDDSVAATIYALWRGQLIANTIDGTLGAVPIPNPCGPTLASCAPGSSQTLTALKRLLQNYNSFGGNGAGGINFFNVPGFPDGPGIFDNLARRDILLLVSLTNALEMAASDEFAPAFGNSQNQEDYRWGKLHRIVFAHPLGGPFNIPPTGGPGNLAADLPGFARAGGLGSLDAASHSARADGLNDFMFTSGPSRRVIATMTPTGPEMLEVIPGGESGVLGSPHQTDQLDLWLVNEYKPMPISFADSIELAANCQNFSPAPLGGQDRIGIDRRTIIRRGLPGGTGGRTDLERADRSGAIEIDRN